MLIFACSVVSGVCSVAKGRLAILAQVWYVVFEVMCKWTRFGLL